MWQRPGSLSGAYTPAGVERQGRRGGEPALVMNFQRIIRTVEKNKAGMALERDGGMGKQEKRAWRGRKKNHHTKQNQEDTDHKSQDE